MSTSDDLVFTAEGHVYRDPAGNVVPSVTQILKETRISADFVTLREFSARRAKVIDTKADIGTAVHADAHAYDDGDLDWDTVHELVKPYVEAWARFRKDKQMEPLLRERFVWHQELGYCGTLDGVFQGPDSNLVLVDLKTGDPESAGAQFQTAAYELALRAEHILPRMGRWSVQLVPDAAVPYRITPYEDYRDEQNWRAIVTVFHLMHVRRPR